MSEPQPRVMVAPKRAGGLRKIFSNQTLFLAILIVILSGITTALNPAFLTVGNILNVLNQISVPAIVSAGAALVMISGNFNDAIINLVILAVIGAATVLWMVFSHRRGRMLDPQAEIDRRINDLEDSLSHLQDIFGQAVRD